MPSFRMQPYDEINGKGFLHHVLVKRGFRSGEVMVVLVGSNEMMLAFAEIGNYYAKHFL